MPLSQDKINDIWQSGYCAEAVRHSAGTEDYDSDIRLAWLRAHIPDCEDCKRANILKNLEGQAALLTGQTEFNDFLLGMDAGNKRVRNVVLVDAIRKGTIDNDFVEWMHEIAKRHGLDFPG